MDDNLKFYLLAEMSGWDCSLYAFKYKEKLVSSTAYKILSVNALQTKNYLGESAKKITNEFENINLEPKTIKEAFIIENKLNYLALHSFPEFYINPLSINPNYMGEINSIGDLIFEVQGQDMKLNDMIIDDTIPLDIKKEAVNERCDYFLEEMNILVNDSLNALKKKAFASDSERKDNLLTILEAFLFISINFLLLFFFTYPSHYFRQAIYVKDLTKAMTYLVYIEPICTLIYDFIFVFYHSYKAKISESYNYARRFIKKNSLKLFDDIKEKKEELNSYINAAITNRIILKNDIKDFSKLSSSYVDYNKVLGASQLKKNKLYRILRILLYIFATISFLVTIITLIIYLVSLSLNATV